MFSLIPKSKAATRYAAPSTCALRTSLMLTWGNNSNPSMEGTFSKRAKSSDTSSISVETMAFMVPA